MITNALVLTLLGIGIVLLVLTPWIILYEGIKEIRAGVEDGINPIGLMVAAGAVLFEVTAALDWLIWGALP